MARFPAWAAGRRIVASTLDQMIPDFTIKGSNESVTSSITLQDDNDLQYAFTETGTYKFELFLLVAAGDSAADIRLGFSFPTGTCHFWGSGPHTGAITTGTSGVAEFFAITSATSGTSFLNYGISSTATIGVHMWGVLIASATGTLKLQWAQDASSATPTTLLAGSWMEVRRVA